MKTLALALLAATLSPASGTEGETVRFKRYDDAYMSTGEVRKKDGNSYLALTDRAAFDKAFADAPFLGAEVEDPDKPQPRREPRPAGLPDDFFDTHMVAAAVLNGPMIRFTVEGVTLAGDGTLTVRYATKADSGGATFSCPLAVAVPRAGVKKVVFVADGKEAGSAEVK